MKCQGCGENINLSDVATVSESDGGIAKDELDIQIRCPKCETNHYTFIPFADLTVEDL